MRMEQESRKRLRRNEIKNAVIRSIAVAGVVAVAAAAPNTLRLLKHAPREWLVGSDPRQRIRENISKLKKKGLIEFTEHDGRKYLHLTAAGKKYAARIESGSMQIQRPQKWDGRWRVIIFDIPENRRAVRQRVRSFLIRLGFYRLQNSVWVHPFECEEIVVILKNELQLGSHMLYMIVDAIEHDAALRKNFNL